MSPGRSRAVAPSALLAGALVAGCLGGGATAPRAVPRGERLVASNVARADYAGSAACAACHADVAAAWERSPMHRMTRDLPGAEVHAPFDGTRFAFKDDAVVLEKKGGARLVRVESGGAARVYRVTRVIGGRTREDFAGVEVGGSPEEVVLPVSFLLGPRTLRYKGYSVMVHERATLRAGPAWGKTCIFCHNTVPEVDRLLGAVAGRRAHPYQGEQVDPTLPAGRRRHVSVVDPDGFARVAAEEASRLGGALPLDADGDSGSAARRLVDVVRDRFDGGALVEVGIGCEACHGGAREHAADPRARPSFDERAPWLALSADRPSKAGAINRVCARCHQVLFSRYPFTWEGGRRDGSPGGSHIASGEARDFLLGGCSGAMACTACHDPHGADSPARLAALATPAGNGTCTSCHPALAAPDALRAHAHHDPAGAGGSCVACHMPRKNMGLDGSLTRYHRIGSPTDPARVLGDRPLECALCHTDKRVGELADAMEKWWPVRFPRQRLEELYGSLDANVIRATLERGRAHEQAVAIGVLAAARARDAVPLLERQVGNEYPLVGEWARRAIEALGAAPPSTPPVARGTDEDPED